MNNENNELELTDSSHEEHLSLKDNTEENTVEEETLSLEENTEELKSAEEEHTPATEVQEEHVETVEDILQRKPYHERYYLRYGDSSRTEQLDLNGTKTFLQGIGFDGGELHQARQLKEQSKMFEHANQDKKNQMYCSYCGAEISGVEYYRLQDGRLRCNTCSRSIVEDKEEIVEICKRILANMDQFFGASIKDAVSIKVMDEKKLKRKLGVPLGTRDSQSCLILGVAINKKGKYSIYLENGAPRISLIATFAHELTHIWQYVNWDNNKKMKKCPKSKRLLIYEGMAKWAEIQYLYLIGETAVAKREEYITRNRKDEYGYGFLLYEDYYPLTREAMTCEETPFTPGRYPF